MRAVQVLAVAALAAAVLPAGPALPGDVPPAAGDLKSRVDAYLEPLSASGLFSGAVLLARDGKVLVEAAFGMADPVAGVPNTPETRFKIMSVSKSLTAVAVMTLVREGKVDLQDPVAKHLAPWPESWSQVRVRHLLDHTSGIPNLESEWALAARREHGGGLPLWCRLAPGFASRTPEAPPGARFRYSNFHYVLLGLLVEAAGGKPYPEALRSRVLLPAGMERTGLDDGKRAPGIAIGNFRGLDGAIEPARPDHDMSGIQAAGGVVSTVGDLWRLDRALRGDAILDAPTRLRMETPAPSSPGYACGWQVSPVAGRPCIHHSGAANAYVADFLRFPEDDACVVVMSNFAFAPAGRVSHALAALLFGRPVAAPARAAPADLAARAGVYAAEGGARGPLLLRRSGATLVAFEVVPSLPRVAGRLLVPLADGAFGDAWNESEVLSFHPPVDGRCSSLRTEPGGLRRERRDPPPAAWADSVGDYRDGASGSGAARLVSLEGRLLLHGPGEGTGPREVVPVSPTLALALLDDEGGILLRLERDAAGRAVRLLLEAGPGRPFVGERVGTPPDPLAGVGEGAAFEVLVLATVHAPWQFRSERFTPAHVRAALDAARPDVVGIECPPEWFARGRYHAVTWEAEGVAVPFARARAIPVVPVDWQELPERERRDAGTESLRCARLRSMLGTGRPLPLAEFGLLGEEAAAAFRESFRNPEFDFARANGIADAEPARPPAGEPGNPSDPGFGGRRNREIAARCVRAMAGRPGKRLVVVIGASHKAVLDALLARVPGVRVLRLGREVPAPSREAVDRAWTREDLLAVLGHNLDGERSCFHLGEAELPRLREVLARLRAIPGTEDESAYFGARLLAAESRGQQDPASRTRDHEEAEKMFASLASGRNSASPYPFPMDHWRMRYSLTQAARIERAQLLLDRGEEREARALLHAVEKERAQAETAARVIEEVLHDPGFEVTAPASSPLEGWWGEGPGGAWRSAPDEEVMVQGSRSLRVELVRAVEPGRAQVGQVIRVPAALRGKPWEFSLRLRGQGGVRAFLVAYRWEDGGRRAVEIARGEALAPGPEWMRAELRVPVAADATEIGIRCCPSGPAGVRLWLDDASPLRVEVSGASSADILAREFPRSLLDGKR